MLNLYLDADACPVKEETFRVAKRYALTVYVVSNVELLLPKADWIVPVVTGKTFDSADQWIVEHVDLCDIVVTNDLLLAEKCLKKSARVIDTRGHELDDENIGDALALRGLKDELRQRGELKLRANKTGKNHRSNYLSGLDLLINKVKKENR